MAKGSYTIDINEPYKQKPYEFKGLNNNTKPSLTTPIGAQTISDDVQSQPKYSYTLPTSGNLTPEQIQEQQLAQSKRSYIASETGNIVAGGMRSGGQIVPTRSFEDSAIQVGGATVAGALTGALSGAAIGAAGGPIGAAGGAVIGGVTALVTGGLNAYLGSKSARETKRQVDAENRRITALNERSRKDQLKQQSFNNRLALADRRTNAEAVDYTKKTNSIQSLWNNYDRGRKNLNDMIAGNQQLKDHFISRGR